MIPLWLMVALGTIQLALIQQARLVTEYAAYSAARAGSVWSGNNERMRDAALLSILPSFGPTATVEALGRTFERARTFDRKVHDALAPRADARESLKQSALLGLVTVDVISPRAFPTDVQELDFDSAETLEGSGDHGRPYERFVSGDLDPNADLIRDATALTVSVRYLYELRLPFANQMIFAAWFASRSVSDGGLSTPLAEFLDASARGASELGPGRRFLLPLKATWTQRMQSSFHRKWLTQPEGP